MAPEPAVHAGEKEDYKSEGDREDKVDPDEAKVVTYPLRLLESHQKRDESRRYYRKEISDEEVPVSNWLEGQNVFLVWEVRFSLKTGTNGLPGL